jgi:hypothetical protein
MHEILINITVRGTYDVEDSVITVKSARVKKSEHLGGIKLARIMLCELVQDGGVDVVGLQPGN